MRRTGDKQEVYKEKDRETEEGNSETERRQLVRQTGDKQGDSQNGDSQ